jgi:hypothetical protein
MLRSGRSPSVPFWEERGTPRQFLQEWQTKDLGDTELGRVYGRLEAGVGEWMFEVGRRKSGAAGQMQGLGSFQPFNGTSFSMFRASMIATPPELGGGRSPEDGAGRRDGSVRFKNYDSTELGICQGKL